MNSSLAVATFLYFLGMVKYLLYLGLRKKILFIMATVMIFAGFVMETVGLVQRSMLTGHGPYTNVFEYCLFMAWAVFGVFLVAEGYSRIKPLGAFTAPVGFFFMLVAVTLSSENGGSPSADAYWLTLHRTLSFVSFGAFTIIFAAGVMYLIQERELKSKHFGGWYHRLPSLEILDDANRVGIIVGFPIITIGMVAAIIWSIQQYGSLMILDFSTSALIIAWVVYAVLTVGRFILRWRGRRAATLGVTGFVIVTISLALHIIR